MPDNPKPIRRISGSNVFAHLDRVMDEDRRNGVVHPFSYTFLKARDADACVEIATERFPGIPVEITRHTADDREYSISLRGAEQFLVTFHPRTAAEREQLMRDPAMQDHQQRCVKSVSFFRF